HGLRSGRAGRRGQVPAAKARGRYPAPAATLHAGGHEAREPQAETPAPPAARESPTGLRDDLPIVHYNMGQAYLYLNDPENLVRCNERVLELERDNGAAHYYAAVGHLALGDLGVSERHLGRAIELGHQPTQDFVKAMEKAHLKKGRQGNVTLIEISGAENPEKKKED
ncbi:MAG: tetratricopeptide repeat protein, partial [Candidatus Competibacteraceae bacterium]